MLNNGCRLLGIKSKKARPNETLVAATLPLRAPAARLSRKDQNVKRGLLLHARCQDLGQVQIVSGSYDRVDISGISFSRPRWHDGEQKVSSSKGNRM
jgi:hypothetical protein